MSLYWFVYEKDAYDTPELQIGAAYISANAHGKLVDIYDQQYFIGTFCRVRFGQITEN